MGRGYDAEMVFHIVERQLFESQIRSSSLMRRAAGLATGCHRSANIDGTAKDALLLAGRPLNITQFPFVRGPRRRVAFFGVNQFRSRAKLQNAGN